MAEALKHPEVMKKAKDELDEIIGRGNMIQETDVSRLPYLQCMVKETLRLHPPVPFLIPRKVHNEVEVLGRIVPKNSQVIVTCGPSGEIPTSGMIL